MGSTSRQLAVLFILSIPHLGLAQSDPSSPLESTGAIVDVALGSGFGCALGSDRTVRCWGQSRDGQAGQLARSVQVLQPITGADGAEQIAAGWGFACVRKLGQVWCWGDNQYGQLGVQGLEHRPVAARVPGLENVVEIGLGAFNGWARLENGQIMCWGNSRYGECGPGVTESRVEPVRVRGVRPAERLWTGHHHVCITDTRGRLFCWGSNDYQQVGGRRGSIATPRRIRNTGDIAEVALGGMQSCIRNTNGHVRCWGSNIFSFGDPARGGYATPQESRRLRNVVSMAAADRNQCAVIDGQVQCWGVNDRLELAVPTPEMGGVVLVPTAVPGVSDVDRVVMAYRTQCVRRSSEGTHEWLCWGWNRQSRNTVGVGSTQTHVDTPTRLPW